MPRLSFLSSRLPSALALMSALSVLGPALAQPFPSVPPAPMAVPGATGGAVRAVDYATALRAARDNIDVSIARRLQAAANADIVAADRKPTPVLSAGAGSLQLDRGLGSGSLLGGKPIDKSVGLDWTLERGNKRALRVQAAQRAAEAAGLDVDEAAVQQQLAVAAAFFDLLSAQERLARLQELERGSAELAQAARRRERAGDISQQEALRTEIEAQRAVTETRNADGERVRAMVRLGQITALPLPLEARADWPAVAPVVPEGAPLDHRADVRAAQRRVEAARASLDSAAALRSADVTVGASMHHLPGTSRAMLEVRMQMPLVGVLGQYGYEGEMARARAQLEQAHDELDRVRLAAASDTARLASELDAAARRVQAFDTEIVPRARRVAEMSELAYTRGALPLVDVIDARRTLRTALLDQLAARADHARAHAAWQLRVAAVGS